MRLAPAKAYLPYNLGLLYQRLNQRDRAAEYYRKAITLNPEMADSLNALGLLYSESGNAAAAENSYREALRKRPGLLAARHNLALLLVRLPGRDGEALDLWRKNLAENPSYLPSRLAMAEALARAGKSAEAIAEYRSVVGMKPDYAGARLELARLLTAAGDPREASEQLVEALRLKPGNTAILEQLGDAYLALGLRGQARQAYEQAMSAAAEAKQRKRLRRKLSQL